MSSKNTVVMTASDIEKAYRERYQKIHQQAVTMNFELRELARLAKRHKTRLNDAQSLDAELSEIIYVAEQNKKVWGLRR
jgi:hypothetical protein